MSTPRNSARPPATWRPTTRLESSLHEFNNGKCKHGSREACSTAGESRGGGTDRNVARREVPA
eukprot:6058394-Alexandrium_andersonii.AAC.1